MKGKAWRSMMGLSGTRLRVPGKRGSTMVEAAYVLPMLLLCVLSVMLLVMYFYASLDAQIKTQQKAIDRSASYKAIFRTVKEETETQSQMQGAVTKLLRRRYVTKHYVFNMTEAIRLGRNLEEE